MDIIIGDTDSKEIERVKSYEEAESKLKGILLEMRDEEFPDMVQNYLDVVEYCAEQRELNRGVKGNHGKAQGVIRTTGGGNTMRHFCSIPLLMKKPVEIWSKDPEFWKDKNNIKKWFPEFLTIDARNL